MQVPRWNGAISFTYEVVTFFLVIALLAVGGMLCFFGYQYFFTLCMVILGCCCGMTGIWIADGMTQNRILQMCFFVMFTFLGTCLFYLVSIVIRSFLKKIHMRNTLKKNGYWIAAVLGAGIIGVVVYRNLYQRLWVAALLFAFFAGCGSLYGKKKAAERKPFYTYEDLLELSPLAGDGMEERHD